MGHGVEFELPLSLSLPPQGVHELLEVLASLEVKVHYFPGESAVSVPDAPYYIEISDRFLFEHHLWTIIKHLQLPAFVLGQLSPAPHFSSYNEIYDALASVDEENKLASSSLRKLLHSLEAQHQILLQYRQAFALQKRVEAALGYLRKMLSESFDIPESMDIKSHLAEQDQIEFVYRMDELLHKYLDDVRKHGARSFSI